MMNRRPGMPARPNFPYQLFNMTDDEYTEYMSAQGYSPEAIEVELERLNKFRTIYQPKKKKTLNDVPINDTEDEAYKALERRLRKNEDESTSD